MGIFNLFRKIKALLSFSNEKEVKLLILGLDNAGKTSCLKRFSDEEIDHIMPTQGFNVKTLNEKGFKVNTWDLGGQKAIRPYWDNYYTNTNGIIFVIDSGDHNRIDEAGIELKNLLKNTKLNKIPLLILANKQDLSNALQPKLISDKLLLNSIRDRCWSIQSCSAKNGDGLKEGLQWILTILQQ